MKHMYIVRAWGRIVRGYRPILSIEITNRCPLSCPGCYAYQPNHVSGTALELISEHTGQNLVDGVLELVAKHRPLLVSLVGGEPLVRYRELSILLPQLDRPGLNVELVTSAVRPIPEEWARQKNVRIVVSIDGLQPEHDARRKPATYQRILTHIEGRPITVHCTVTGQMTRRPGYIEEFLSFWNARPEVQMIRISLFTPQVGETREEVLQPADREQVIADLRRLHSKYPKLRLAPHMSEAYLKPPGSPDHCIFSQVTRCVSSDLQTLVVPCQLGGTPDCSQCGCVAAMGFQAVGRATVVGLPLGAIFRASWRIGQVLERIRTELPATASSIDIEKPPATSGETS